jgi:multidrug resistance efflux pump
MSERTPQKPGVGKVSRGRRTVYGALLVVLPVFIAAFQLRPQPAASQQRTRPLPRQVAGQASPPPADAATGGQAVAGYDGKGPVALIGTVQANQATLSVIQPARVTGIAAREGDRVRHGETLIRLDAATGQAQERTAAAGIEGARAQLAKAKAGGEAQRVKADADVTTAQAGLAQAQDKLQQALLARDAAQANQQADLGAAQENVRKARLGLETARKTLNSLEQLDTVGGVARNNLEGARTQVASAQSDLNQAEAQVRRLQAGPPGGTSFRVALASQDVAAAQLGVQQARGGIDTALRARRETLRLAQSDIAAAAAGVQQAEAGLGGAQAAAQWAMLKCPLDGVVSAVNIHPGETAQPGAPLLTIVAQAGYRIEALVTSRQLPQLHVGQAAQVTLDTRPGQVFAASLYAISHVAEPDGRSFRIKLRFVHIPANLRPDQGAHILFVAP